MAHQIYRFFYGPQSINHRLFMLINHTCTPLLDTVMPVFTLLGGSQLVYLYFLILAVCINALGNGMSGLMSGFMGGFIGVMVHSNREKNAASSR